MASPSRPYKTLGTNEIIEQAEQLLASADTNKLRLLLEEISKRRRAERKLSTIKKKIEKQLSRNATAPGSTAASFHEGEERNQVDKQEGHKKNLGHNAAQKKPAADNPLIPKAESNYLEKHPLPEKKEISIHEIRKSGPELMDTPDPLVFNLEESSVDGLDVSEISRKTWAERFYHALNQRISDSKKKSSKSISFQQGRKVVALTSAEDSIAYIVNVSSRADELFPGSSVVLRTANGKTDGRVVAISGASSNEVTLTVEEDLGEHLNGGDISVDDTAMDMFIRDLLARECGISRKGDKDKKSTKKGLLLEFASNVLSNQYQLLDEPIKASHLEKLNSSQASFIEKALSYNFSILWGPPGTGKTQTLTSVIKNLCDAGEKTLICSNTNMAVDQVFLKCCREDSRSYVDENKFVRIGNISHKDLIRDHRQQVTVEGISEKLGLEFKEEIAQLLSRKSHLIDQSSDLLDKSSLFDELDRVGVEIQRSKSEFLQTQALAKSLRDEISSLEDSANELRQKYNDRSSGRGGLGGVFGRTPETLRRQIDALEKDILHKNSTLDGYRSKLLRLKDLSEDLATRNVEVSRQLSGIDRDSLNARVLKIKADVGDIDSRCRKLEESLQALKQTIIENSFVVGATLAKTCMNLGDLGFYDNVIIDEASMASLPMLFVAASIAKKRVIVSGDFSQLSPICQTDNKLIKDILGKSIFEVCGIEDDVRSGSGLSKNLGFLDTQYRMQPSICNLISGYMYNNQLHSGLKSDPINIIHPLLDSLGELVLIDTSPLLSFSSTPASGGKINLLHAYIARKLLLQVADSNNLSLGYCTPFAAQSRLFSKLLTEQDQKVITSVGTVHQFQGDERDLLVFDTVVAQSESNFLAPFINSIKPQDEGAKNLNVAISRAKKSLVVLADLNVLDKQLSNYSFLREVLFSMQMKGRVVDARALVDKSELGAIEAQLSVNHISVAKTSIQDGMVDETSFFPLLYKNIEEAKNTIVIFSGFFTPSRVDEVLTVLRKPIEDGVTVKFVLPTNQTNGSFGRSDPSKSFDLVRLIRDRGVVVEQRNKLHQKAVLIDDDLAWYGSLNPLSFAGSTLESMLLVRQPGIALELAKSLSLPGPVAPSSMVDWAQSENPKCPKCGSRTVYAKSRFGFYFPCEDLHCDGKARAPRR
ncbi:AAA domain-containing protein [Synechococcus sp. A15-28]|uniref:AAA domain-containing protein n=1 Tax=Synechococcus sp. A15-28 TaxID=1050638 RepID=UPI0016465B9C|nr:AAA domain-containing protein [Synechococcus sp. A15-28]QNI43121.1 AAA domain protein [Synechococcus sp. A15-28]